MHPYAAMVGVKNLDNVINQIRKDQLLIHNIISENSNYSYLPNYHRVIIPSSAALSSDITWDGYKMPEAPKSYFDSLKNYKIITKQTFLNHL